MAWGEVGGPAMLRRAAPPSGVAARPGANSTLRADPAIARHERKRPMTTVAEILKSKPDAVVHTIGPDASVFEAVSLMAQKNIGALLVAEGGQVVGIVSERDYARKVALMARSSRETPLRDIMSSPVMFVQPGQTSEECMALMTENRLRHLPVMSGGKLIGLVSIGDLVKNIISEQKFIIEQLEHYIAGVRG
jgi:CBS domain-containing protein